LSPPTFADTSFYIALARPQDAWHRAARQLLDVAEQRDPLHTTALVVAEVVAMVGPFEGGKAAMAVYDALNREGVVHFPRPNDYDAAMRIVLRFDGKLSLCDALTLHTMELYGATDLLSFDKDFDGKGVNRLASPPRRG
jgi:predicted nucleic acid-binding protein